MTGGRYTAVLGRCRAHSCHTISGFTCCMKKGGGSTGLLLSTVSPTRLGGRRHRRLDGRTGGHGGFPPLDSRTHRLWEIACSGGLVVGSAVLGGFLDSALTPSLFCSFSYCG